MNRFPVVGEGYLPVYIVIHSKEQIVATLVTLLLYGGVSRKLLNDLVNRFTEQIRMIPST